MLRENRFDRVIEEPMKRRVCRSDSVGHLDPGERPSVERHALPVLAGTTEFRTDHDQSLGAVGVRDEPTQRRRTTVTPNLGRNSYSSRVNQSDHSVIGSTAIAVSNGGGTLRPP